MFIGGAIGINALILGITGFMGGALNKSFSKESKMTVIIILSLLTFFCELIAYLVQVLIFSMNIEILTFIRVVLIEVLYNVAIAIIIYPLFQKAGRGMEKIFNEKKIYTEYY